MNLLTLIISPSLKGYILEELIDILDNAVYDAERWYTICNLINGVCFNLVGVELDVINNTCLVKRY